MITSEARFAVLPLHQHAPEHDAELPGDWLAGLNRLEQACARHAEVDQKLRNSVIQVAQQIARRLGTAGLADTPLPRNYWVRYLDRQWLLVKCNEDGSVKFVASGQQSLWTRLGLHVTELTGEHILELSMDFDNGLLEEMAVCIEGKLKKANLSTRVSSQSVEPTGNGKLRLIDLGRKSRAQSSKASRPRARDSAA